MAVRTTSLIPFKINDIPDRYTMLYVSDDTVSTTSASGTSATQRINRVQSASFSNATGVIDVVEMGSVYRPGGVANLGEISWNMTFNAVGIHNMAALTGSVIPTTKGQTLTISSTTINLATPDFIRLVADNAGNVIGTLYMQDTIINDYTVSVSEGGLITEAVSGKGPNAMFFAGFIIPKAYLVTSTDQTNQYITVSSLFSTSEAPTQIYQSPYGQPPSFWQQNGSVYWFKIERVPGTGPGGVANLSNTPIRYFEYLYNSTASTIAVGTQWVTPAAFSIPLTVIGQNVSILGASAETVTIAAVAPQVNTTSTTTLTAGSTVTITPASMAGIEVGVTVTIDTVASGVQEVQPVSALVGTTAFKVATLTHNHTSGCPITTTAPSFQATFASTHSANVNLVPALAAAQQYRGTAYYIPGTSRILFGDTINQGDVIRLVFASYNTDTSLPVSVPNNADPTDRPGVPARMIPLTIGGLAARRIQRASYKMALKRDHVQGIGENAISYGVSSVPDVSIDLDAKETDLSLLAQINIGTQNLTSQGGPSEADFEDLDFITRNTLANAIPTAINLYDPFNAGNVLCSWSSPQFIPTSIGYSSSNKSDNTIRITGMDITGNMILTYTAPY